MANKNNMPQEDMMDMVYPQMGNCIPQETVIKNVKLAAAYVPFQKFCALLSPIEALSLGTAFPELYSPYKKPSKKAKPHEKDRKRYYYE